MRHRTFDYFSRGTELVLSPCIARLIFIFENGNLGNFRFLDSRFLGEKARDGDLKAKLEVARLEGGRDIFAGCVRSDERRRTYTPACSPACLPASAYLLSTSTYLPTYPRIFKYSFSHTDRPRVHLLPPDSAPQPPPSPSLLGRQGMRRITPVTPR